MRTPLTDRAALPPVRVGLIGAGAISREHVPGLLALGAAVTVHSERGTAKLAAQFDLPTADSLTDLWPQVDIVDIVTPTAMHHSLALEAIRHGKHVICEKPLALTSADAAAVHRAATSAGVRVLPAHVVRYFPQYAKAREAVIAGHIGEPAVFRFRRQSAAPGSKWFFDDAISGGIVMDQMIHDLDQAEWLAGPVRRVFARSMRRDTGAAAVIAAQVILDHESGAISHVHGTWGNGQLPFSYSFDLAGTAGVLRYDSARDDNLRVSTQAQASPGYLPPVDGSPSPYATQLADFIDAIRTGGEARVSATDGIRAVQIAEAARLSIEASRPVYLDDSRATDAGAHHPEGGS